MSHMTAFLLFFLAENPDKRGEVRKKILPVVVPKGQPITAEALTDFIILKLASKRAYGGFHHLSTKEDFKLELKTIC